MPSWYDIKSLSAHRELETCEGIAESEAAVRALAAGAGVPASRVALVGFSQGGALTLYTALRAPGAPFAAAAVLSGYMPLPGQIAPSPAVLAETPLLLCHGDRDAVVPLAYGRDAAERARALGVAALTFKTYAGMGHGAGDEELRDLIAFLRKHLPPLPAAGGGGGGGAAEGVE
jgi:predicted esterase